MDANDSSRTRLNDDTTMNVNEGEELGAWGVPESVEESTGDTGYPAGIGMPGITSGSDNEWEQASTPGRVGDNDPQPS